MADDPDPPRQNYGFKQREIETVNAPTNEPQPLPPVRVQDLINHAVAPAKPGAVPQPSPLAQDNEVHAMLRANVARDNAAGLNELIPLEKRPSRRRRDFWFLIISGNLLLGSLALACGAAGNPMVFVCSVGGIGMISASLYWVMFHIMDDY
jgi:hypothetical protein